MQQSGMADWVKFVAIIALFIGIGRMKDGCFKSKHSSNSAATSAAATAPDAMGYSRPNGGGRSAASLQALIASYDNLIAKAEQNARECEEQARRAVRDSRAPMFTAQAAFQGQAQSFYAEARRLQAERAQAQRELASAW